MNDLKQVIRLKLQLGKNCSEEAKNKFSRKKEYG